MKGMRKEWVNMNFLVVVPCNDADWIYAAVDDVFEAWKIARKYHNGYVWCND